MKKMKEYKIIVSKTAYGEYQGNLSPVESNAEDTDESPWVEECSSRDAVIAGLRAISKVMKWRIVEK